jgi:hypothetical protein
MGRDCRGPARIAQSAAIGRARARRAFAPGAPGIDRRLDRRRLDRDGDVEVVAVAAGHRQRDRDLERAEQAEDAAVARQQACGAELEAAEPVAFVRVGAGEIERQAERLLAVLVGEHAQGTVERAQVVGVAAAVGQGDVEVARRLAEREVPGAVERDREHARVAGEDRRRAVALVDVEVDDDDAQRRLGLQQARRDGDVVEDAVAAAARRRRVVRAAGEVGGDALVERGPGRRHRRTHRPARALDHLLAPWKADRALLGGAERSRCHGGDIRGFVDAEQVGVGDGLASCASRSARAATRSRSSRYLERGKRCPGGRGRRCRSEWNACIAPLCGSPAEAPENARRRLLEAFH